MNNEWYNIIDVDRLDSPCLVIFPDRVQKNIHTAIGMVGDVTRLRPHVKTNKSAEATRLMLDAGITKFKCATIAEAEMLGMTGAADVLLAYQPLGPKLARFIELVRKFPGTYFSCLVDNPDAAREQSLAFQKANITVAVYVDLNVGMNRTGIEPRDAVKLCQFLATAQGVKFGGLHAYDGHIRDKDFEARTKNCDQSFTLVEELITDLANVGIDVARVIAGGSPTFPIHAKRKNVECSPGTFIYWDQGYLELCPEQDFLPAAALVTRVISMPSDLKLCTDLGHKSVAAENEIGRRVHFLNASLTPLSQSEEHLVCENEPGAKYKTGDVLYGLPYHICPTVALYERAYTIENEKVSGEWKMIARDRKITV